MAVYKSVTFVCALLVLLPACHGYPTGAPATACVSLHPGHMLNATNAVVPQTSTSPYSIVVDGDKYTPGTALSVRIVGPVFRGFLIQARKPGMTTPIGTFSNAPADTKTAECTIADSSMTHANPNQKENITLTWNPPSTGVGNVHFIATVAEMKVTYWMDVTSAEISEDSSGGASLAKPTFYLLILCLIQAVFFLK